MTKCGSTDTASGKPCGRAAGWGTEHKGEGFCRAHDLEDGLTTKQRRFVEEYCADCNGTQAAIRAGYSEHSAAEIAYENLRKPQIAEAIKERLKQFSMTAAEATKRLSDMARGSIGPFLKIDEQGRVWFNLADPEAQQHFHLIKKIKSQRRTELGENQSWDVEWVQIELHDAQAALNLLLRAHGAFGAKGTEDDPIHHEHKHDLGWASGPEDGDE